MKARTFKKIPCILLVLAIVMGMIPVASFAAGDTFGDPVICTSYSELKAALEDENIIYVSLGDVDEVLPVIEGEGSLAAITVKGTKRLKLTGYSKFVAPMDGMVYDCLIQVSNSKLYIQGSGQLSFVAVGGKDASNAVIRNTEGKVVVYDCYLRGLFHRGTHSMAIYQDSGELVVHKGFFFSENGDSISGNDNATYAVYIGGGLADIWGGNFSTSNYGHAEGFGYGLCISENANVDILGGTFYGIKIPSASTLGDYISDDLTMIYSGEKVNPNDYDTITGNIEVEIYREITSVDVNINAPSNGNHVSTNVYNIPEGAYLHTANWYENGEPIESTSKFVAGRSYKVNIYLIADVNAMFSKNLTSATVNYENAELINYSNKPELSIGLSMDFGVCPDTINSVEFTIDSPKEHSAPDQSVICRDSTYKQALANDNMFDAPLQWQVSTDGKAWSVMKTTDTFSVGNYYRVFVDIMPSDGYEFAIDEQIEPFVTAKVNGNNAVVTRYPEADPSTLISVCYNFGILNDNVIEEINISGVAEPIVGEKPSYDCAMAGTGYTINTAYSNNTYVINGICWRDITDDKWVYPKDTFQIGHKYGVYIDVKTESGFDFYTSGNSNKPEGWGYINGNYATLGVKTDANKEQSLSYEFECQPKTVNSIAVSGLDIPADGSKPDFDAITDSDYYSVTDIVWTDYENDMEEMTENDTFIGGNKYYVLITVEPKQENGVNLCKFVSGKTTASLNGIEVKPIASDSWQDVTSSVKAVRIWYVFQKATSENDLFISGSAKSFGNEEDEITVSLYKENALTPEYKQVIKGNNANYHFASVDDGTYTIKVSKKNHTTVEYTVSVYGKSVIQNVELWLLGDVTGDGIINSTDYIRIKGHFLGTFKLTGTGLLCGDVTEDGVINSTDYIRIKSHFLGTYNLHG